MDHGRQLLSDLEARVCATEVLRRVGIAHADAVVGCEARGLRCVVLGRISGPFPPVSSPQAALKRSCCSDRVTRY